jgi:hypothetical protein
VRLDDVSTAIQKGAIVGFEPLNFGHLAFYSKMGNTNHTLARRVNFPRLVIATGEFDVGEATLALK